MFLIISCRKKGPAENNKHGSEKYFAVTGTVFRINKNDSTKDIIKGVSIVLDKYKCANFIEQHIIPAKPVLTRTAKLNYLLVIGAGIYN